MSENKKRAKRRNIPLVKSKLPDELFAERPEEQGPPPACMRDVYGVLLYLVLHKDNQEPWGSVRTTIGSLVNGLARRRGAKGTKPTPAPGRKRTSVRSALDVLEARGLIERPSAQERQERRDQLITIPEIRDHREAWTHWRLDACLEEIAKVTEVALGLPAPNEYRDGMAALNVAVSQFPERRINGPSTEGSTEGSRTAQRSVNDEKTQQHIGTGTPTVSPVQQENTGDDLTRPPFLEEEEEGDSLVGLDESDLVYGDEEERYETDAESDRPEGTGPTGQLDPPPGH